ncbi:expressed unknown protein [Seminavis robusta]|uniref:Uncharacterized protein n=1 Tax=Seminavis robusta TaxID=568900 RepID=A0A9N8ECT7_9STRA|nr:expressed unknown protein [Seminavis robusta]|eukprot:Sro935_g222010.1 n/a (188) ;mRNA; r:30655-31218
MTEQPPDKILREGDVLRMEVSPKYATIQIQPNIGSSEGNDPNFPRNLHNAVELFLKCGLVPNGVRLKDCTDKLLEIYAKDPSSNIRLGRGCICWKCGYCGIPKDYSESNNNNNNNQPPGPCVHCHETQQINWVRVTHPTNGELPWIERANVTEEEKQAELAAKRAAVEARVAQALKEREEAAALAEK